ncbi:MAG: hypothetical protein ACD_45C00012G0005 [uncultured bacterium]|nr:MAG: hypothetical protein ACD_45C00012G0005 [uncultured bacterium]
MKSLFEENITILTPNRRLAATLLKQFQHDQIKQHKTCWKSLDILPLQSWLQRLWHEYSIKTMAATPLLLTTYQEIILWEEILQKFQENNYLMQLSATAALAQSAWQLLKLWQVNINDSILRLTEDGQLFQQWALQFKKIGKKNNWLDTASLPDALHEPLLAQSIELPKKIMLIGFTELSPQHQHLFNLCQEAGSEIIQQNELKKPACSINKIGLPDKNAEIYNMARWAKTLYDTYDKKTPYLIGCVVPELETLRDSIWRIFAETFTENNTITRDPALLPFNISAGKNLIAFPIIHTALQLLKLYEENIPIETISHLLRSPFLGKAEQEQLSRAYFDSQLRTANLTTISLNKLLLPNKLYNLEATCQALARQLKNYFQYINHLPTTLHFSAWSKKIIDLLTLLGWPGERSLNSEEYQVTQRWLDLFTEFNALEHILAPQTFSRALYYLTQLSMQTVFQPQTPEAPIQIVGVLEAIGLPFEHTWIMGFDDANWPAAPKPHPLIPTRLQKKLQMPHATTERELNYCEKLTNQLMHCAKNIIFSYPKNNNEDIELRPSYLLNSIHEISLSDIQCDSSLTIAQKIYCKNILEDFVDDIAPSITDKEEIRGGAYIFKQQAACPFKAFAELRLHARQLDTPTLGLRAIDRGNIMHKALEFMWQVIKDSTTLAQLSTTELIAIAQKSAAEAMQSILHNNTQQRYLSLELKRLEKLLLEWLDIEKKRPKFKVALQEHEINTTISNIPITLRIDRIDEINEEHYLIIDYKTGKNNPIKNWFGDRPDEPQLPLYCITSDHKTIGIAFAELHPDNMSLSGVSKKNIGIQSIKTLAEISHAKITLWDQQLQEWRTILENLGHDFQRGIAKVDPKDRNQTCTHCKLHTFCRIHEQI